MEQRVRALLRQHKFTRFQDALQEEQQGAIRQRSQPGADEGMSGVMAVGQGKGN
jgi:hypothetical protein